MSKQRKLLNLPFKGLKMKLFNHGFEREKVVFIMGATGTGKSKLAIDIASHFPSEIINSDKIQLYKGLDIATNKVTAREQRGIPHHLLGISNPHVDFPVKKFCYSATLAVQSIIDRNRLPIIVGGSNSYIEALVDRELKFRSNYECCFIWIDVSVPILRSFLSNRVDKMIGVGMLEEVREFFDPNGDYSQGIRRAIGVPEFDRYFRFERHLNEESKAKLFHEAKMKIKENTFKLAERQLDKINRLRNIKGWNIHRIDAAQAFKLHGREADNAWEKLVAAPSASIVGRFLYNFDEEVSTHSLPPTTRVSSTRTAIVSATP